MNQREHRLQAMVDRLIDRIVMQPMFVTGIDHASQTTENARARARGRGIKPGVADVFVCQGEPPKVLWMELKRGTQPTEAQLVFQRSMRACGIPSYIVTSIEGARIVLMDAGFRLHGNSANIALELGQRLEALDRTAEAQNPKSSTKSRARSSPKKAKHWGVARLETLP